MVVFPGVAAVWPAQDDTTAEGLFESSGPSAVDWIIAGLILVSGIALSIVVRRVVISVLRRGTTLETIAERLVGTLVQAAIALVGLAYALAVLDVQIGPLLGALGLGGFAVALALQETLKNLFAGVILHAQRPVRLGEEVVSGEMQGVVVDITARAVTLRSNSGRILFVPNSMMLDREIVNLVRHGVRRTTLVVGVAYGSDLRLARQVLHDATVAAEGVFDDPPVRVRCIGFADSSVDFDIDFWHGPIENDRREACSAVSINVHEALGEAGITIPFPQRTLWTGDRAGPAAG